MGPSTPQTFPRPSPVLLPLANKVHGTLHATRIQLASLHEGQGGLWPHYTHVRLWVSLLSWGWGHRTMEGPRWTLRAEVSSLEMGNQAEGRTGHGLSRDQRAFCRTTPFKSTPWSRPGIASLFLPPGAQQPQLSPPYTSFPTSLSFPLTNLSGHRTGKGQLSFQSQRRAMPKNTQTTAHLHSSHMLAK